MDILAALMEEELKFLKQMDAARQQLETVRAAIKILARDVAGSHKPTRKRRQMSASARARISKATKARWAKYRAAKAKGKQ
jgi:glutamine synthetase adenylyltransferase